MESIAHLILLVHAICGVHSYMKMNTWSAPYVRNTPYNPRITNKVCFLKPEKGPCRANLEMIYFSPEFRNCSTFKWGGCQGNGNRFNTLEDCNKFCLSPPNEDRNRPKYCSHTFDYGFCFGAVDRYYYDFKWKICKPTVYSGCGGNRNNFQSEEECEQVCRVGRYVTRPTTMSDRLKKVIILNAQNGTTKKSRIQVTERENLRAGGGFAGNNNDLEEETQDRKRHH